MKKFKKIFIFCHGLLQRLKVVNQVDLKQIGVCAGRVIEQIYLFPNLILHQIGTCHMVPHIFSRMMLIIWSCLRYTTSETPTCGRGEGKNIFQIMLGKFSRTFQ